MWSLVSNEIVINEPDASVINYCKNNLIINNPEYAKRKRMGKFIGNTPKELYLYRIDGDKIIIPTGCLDILLGCLDIKYDLANNHTISFDNNISLYDYQIPAVNEVTKHNFGILQAPCGSGKTQMGIAIATRLGRKTLWLTHTHDLLNQSYERALQYIDKKHLGKITSGKIDIADGITFATVQTLSKQDLSIYKYSFDVIIVDECHRCAGTPTSVSMFSKVINSIAARYKYGLSATVHRSDGLIKSTFAIIGPIIYVVPKSAVAEKTMQVTIQKVDTMTEISDDCLDTDGTLIFQNLIKYLATDAFRTAEIVIRIMQNAEHSQLVLSDRLEHLERIKESLVYAGYEVDKIRFINGKMTSKKGQEERKQAIEGMRSGRAKVLLATYSLAKEGLDIPNLDRLHLTLPKKDYAVVIQSVGRIGRTAEGKDSAITYDYVDNIGYCINSWKKRKTSYKKERCLINEVES